ELEPMLRQALALRCAFAASPDPAYRERTKEKLLFVAGREAIQAYDATPSEDFVGNARERLLESAGRRSQEALRAIPPPRLPFWANARRRLLAAATEPGPQRRPAPAFGPIGMRPALAGAFAALVLLVSTFTFLNSQGGRSASSVNDDFAS